MTTRRTVPFDLLRLYTTGIDWYFIEHEGEEPPHDLSVFQRDSEEARQKAQERDELDALRAAIDFALVRDEAFLAERFSLSLAEIINSENYQSEEVLKEILAYYRKVIWPDAPPPDAAAIADVEMVKMGLDEWRRQRATKP